MPPYAAACRPSDGLSAPSVRLQQCQPGDTPNTLHGPADDVAPCAEHSGEGVEVVEQAVVDTGVLAERAQSSVQFGTGDVPETLERGNDGRPASQQVIHGGVRRVYRYEQSPIHTLIGHVRTAATEGGDVRTHTGRY